MTKYCAPSCGTCHMLDFKFRCPLNTSEPEALQPGDLHRLFERITGDGFYQQFEPRILSMPSPSPEQKESGIVDGPWVVVLDKFLSPEECDRLIDLGAIEGYVESADVGRKNFDGTYDKSVNIGRTSTNAWCEGVCYDDKMARNVTARIENVTGIPEANSEYLQLLRYEPGQYYNTHHDYIPHQIDRQMGVRTLTVFLYLNDVEAGGGTEFPNLGLTVHPKKGRALIWPSVLNENPNAKDQRTEHGALPVEKGIKYGANAWLHQRDIKAVMQVGCI
jgi:prolyl 4-hydroxylase